ncbi:MAG: GIY-YIG nuclease family protein, partial [Candidatus Aminicenantaceae bacterium]
MLNKLINTINSLPDEPGIYFFKDDKKNIIYIGKARSIKKRVQSYLRLTTDPKVIN